MKLAYQVAMPDLESSPLLTAYQGSLEDSFRHLAENGYQGIELMVRDPQKLDPELLNRLTSTYGLEVVMLATGEIWAQDHISLSSSNPENRLRCIKRFKEFIDCAAPYHAQVNIGRVRGELVPGIPPETTLDLASWPVMRRTKVLQSLWSPSTSYSAILLILPLKAETS